MSTAEKQRSDYRRAFYVESEFNFEALLHGTKSVLLPTAIEDMSEHWDCRMVSGEKNIKVDIKGIKSRDFQSTFIEFLNVHGEDGWLFGKADYIAFETPYNFYFVKRKKLLEHILRVYLKIEPSKVQKFINDETCSNELRAIITDPEGMTYQSKKFTEYGGVLPLNKRYNRDRSERKDVVMRVLMSDILKLAEKRNFRKSKKIVAGIKHVSVGDTIYYVKDSKAHIGTVEEVRNSRIGCIVTNNENKRETVKKIIYKLVENNS